MSARTSCLLAIAAASVIAAPALAQPGRPQIGRGTQPPLIAQPPAPLPTPTPPVAVQPDSLPQATAQPATAQPAPGAGRARAGSAPPPAAVEAPARSGPAPPAAAPVVTEPPARSGPALSPGAPSPVVADPPAGRGAPGGRFKAIVDDPGFRVLRRTPIEFRPYALSDVGPGATAERQLTLPNRKSLTVEAYLSEINAIQQRLNEIGYSLEDLGDTPETATVIEEPALTGQQLGVQSSAIRARHTGRGSVTAEQAALASRAKFEPAFAAGRAGQPALLQALADRPVARGGGSATGIEKSWGLPIGDPNSAWVSLDGDFVLDGSDEGTTMAVTQRARGSVLGHDLEFLSMTGMLTSPMSEPGLASLEFRVLGNTVPVMNESPQATGLGLSKDGVASNPISWTFSNPLSVGGVGMDVEFTLGGLTGVQYYVAVGGGSVVGVVTPFVTVEVGAEIEVIDAYVLEAGVAGELVLIDERLVMAGSASLQYDNAAGKPYLYYDYLGVNVFEALQGDLNVYTCAYVISNWQPKKKCWRKYLWKEDGIDVQDELFSGSERVYLD